MRTAKKVMPAATKSSMLCRASESMPRLLVEIPATSLSAVSSADHMTLDNAALLLAAFASSSIQGPEHSLPPASGAEPTVERWDEEAAVSGIWV